MKPVRVLNILVFGVSMGFLEAAVVVYLRLLYYPAGFDFPLIRLPLRMALVEVGREAATILMLWAVAALTGRDGRERFAWFSILFGLWDIVYYVVLKVVLDWPASILTWDILFLIPLIWTGPVVAPVLISMALIASGWVMLHQEKNGVRATLGRADLLLLGMALLLCLYSFMANHSLVYEGGVPESFPWLPFGAGMLLGLFVLVKAARFRPASGVASPD